MPHSPLGIRVNSPKSILVFRTGHLGDTVCAIPAFRLIRNHFPDAELTLVCDRPDQSAKVAAVEVVENLRIFDHIRTYNSGRSLRNAWQLFRTLRAIRPDILIVLPQVRETLDSFSSKKHFFLRCGVSDVRGFQRVAPNHAWNISEPDRLIQMLNAVGLNGSKPSYNIPIDKRTQDSVDEKLVVAGANLRRPFVVFCGGGKEATQHWPLDRYTVVLERLKAEFNLEFIGVGSPHEVESYREQVLPRFSNLRLLPEGLSVPELFELCRRATLYFGNDTGPMHVAAAVGTPVAVVMSARNPLGVWDPDIQPRLVIRHRTECEGCILSQCIADEHRCMKEISVEQVADKLIQFLQSLLLFDGQKNQKCVASQAY